MMSLARTAASDDDGVTLELAGKALHLAEAYEVDVDVFTTPAKFSLSLGHAGIASELLRLAEPRTPFRLSIAGRPVMSGLVDGPSCNASDATVRISGRDYLQELRTDLKVERNFGSPGPKELVEDVLQAAGIKAPVVLGNAANRAAVALGTKVLAEVPASLAAVRYGKPHRMTIGEEVHAFLNRTLAHSGLFLLAAADGSFVVTDVDPDLAPLYSLVHAPLDRKKRANVIDFAFRFETTERASKFVVYARAGGKKSGVLKHRGEAVDEEMVGFGYVRPRGIRDWDGTNDEEASLYARRKIAAQRRRSWQLHFVVNGHTTRGPHGERAIWAPDTTVNVDSGPLELRDVFYIGGVTYRRSEDAGTTTEIRLTRRSDLLFGSEDDS